MIPAMPVEPEPIATLPEAPATLRDDERRESCDHGRIPSCTIHERPIVRRPAESYCGTGPLNRKAALTDQVRDDLPPFSGP